MGVVKFFMTGIGLLLMIPAVLAIFFSPQLLDFARGRFEARMSDILQTPVTIAKLRVQPGLGRIELQGVRALNPAGFAQETAFEIGRASVSFDPLTIFGETPEASSVVIADANWRLRHEPGAGVNLVVLARTAHAAGRETLAGLPPLRVEKLEFAPSTMLATSELLGDTGVPLTLEAFSVETPGAVPLNGAGIVAEVLDAALARVADTDELGSALRGIVREGTGTS